VPSPTAPTSRQNRGIRRPPAEPWCGFRANRVATATIVGANGLPLTGGRQRLPRSGFPGSVLATPCGDPPRAADRRQVLVLTRPSPATGGPSRLRSNESRSARLATPPAAAPRALTPGI